MKLEIDSGGEIAVAETLPRSRQPFLHGRALRRLPAEFGREYARALDQSLAGADEVALVLGHQLGRRAIARRVSLVDVVTIHGDLMKEALWRSSSARECGEKLEAGSAFLKEVVTVFEMTSRGFREATEAVANTLQFSGMLTHEVRTPLTSILASAGMLQELLAGDPKSYQGKLLSNILAGANTLKASTDDLLDAVGFECGTLSIHTQPVDTKQLLKELYDRVEPEVRETGQHLNLEAQESLPVIVADPERLTQAITNLVFSAVRYGSGAGQIDLRARVTDGSFVVEVQDYGKGVSSTGQRRLLQPYARWKKGGRDIPGLGIGLSLCRGIAKAHGGTVVVESEPGKGSRFQMIIPVWETASGRGGWK